MSATGVILMYEHQLVEYAERDVREITPPGGGAQRMSLDELVTKARAQNPEARPTGVVLRNEPTASVAVAFGREGAAYINPYTGAVLGRALSCTTGFMRHRLAPLARHGRRRPRDWPRHHRRL